MYLNTEFVFSSLNPYVVLKDLGINVRKVNDTFCVKCTHCDTRTLQVGTRELYCSNQHCGFVAGSIVDFLASLPKNNYEKAVDYIFNKYFDRLHGIEPSTSEFFKVNITENLKNRRKILKLLISFKNNNTEHTKCVEAQQWFRKNHINPTLTGLMVLSATNLQFKDLVNTIYEGSESPFSEIPDGDYVIFPYFSSYSTLSSIKATHIRSGRVFKCNIQPARYSCIGIHNGNIEDQDYRIYEDPIHACMMLSYHRDNSEWQHRCISIQYDPTATEEGIRLKSGTFMYAPGHSLSLPAKLVNVIKKFSITSSDVKSIYSSETVSWNIFVLQQFKDLVQTDKTFTTRISAFIETIDPNEELKNLLKRFLRSGGYNEILEHFNSFGFVDRLYKLKSYNVIETPTGYIAQRPNKPERFPFTNFIIRFDYNLVFSDPVEVFHVGHVYMRGRKYPFILPRKNLSKYALIEKAAVSAFKQVEKGRSKFTQIPCIIDTTFGGALSTLLNTNAASLQSYEGISRLGWSDDKQSLTTPTWQSYTTDITDTSTHRHPDVRIFDNYLFQEYRKDTKEYSNNDVVQLLGLLVSLLCRSYYDLPYPDIRISNTVKARNLLKFLFLPLGQVKPIQINGNRRVLQTIDAQFKGLNKYPIYGSCSDPSALKGVDYPIMLLADDGIHVQLGLNKEQYNGVTTLVHNVITDVSQWLLRQDSLGFEFLEETDIFQCIHEGLRIIKTVCNREFKLETKFIKFRQFLYQYSEEEISKYLKFDFENQKIIIGFWNSQIKRMEVFDELSEHNESVELKPTRYIVADVTYIQEILESFYGKQLPLPLYEESPLTDTSSSTEEDYQEESLL